MHININIYACSIFVVCINFKQKHEKTMQFSPLPSRERTRILIYSFQRSADALVAADVHTHAFAHTAHTYAFQCHHKN